MGALARTKPIGEQGDGARIARLADAARAELRDDIIPFWLGLRDRDRGGFFGAASAWGKPSRAAAKSAVLEARILWFFSASYERIGDAALLEAASAAYEFIAERLIDAARGGVFWTVSAEGAPIDQRKHLYAQAFAITALAAYHRASADAAALALAEGLWAQVAEHAADLHGRGYRESFSGDWAPVANELMGRAEAEHTFNAHLHLLEAGAELFSAAPRSGLGERIETLVRLLIEQAFDPARRSFHQFFDADWRALGASRSFGHDIEACWLVPTCAQRVSPRLAAEVRVALEGVAASVLMLANDREGGVITGDDGAGGVDRGRIWWVQAEAMIGFIDAFEQCGDGRFLDAAERLWRFIERRVIDRRQGEWRARVARWDALPSLQPKADGWKCPYHNGRACLELMSRAARIGGAPPAGDGASPPSQDTVGGAG